jgi:hypothetical protein
MGCCLALELAQRGYRVDLVERASTPMTGASLHNEGKLHLGFVYANDPVKETHGLMARGSMAFSRIIEKLTGFKPVDLAPAQPFHYFVPIDSQLDMNAIDEHFQRVEEAICEIHRRTGDLYLDLKTDRYYERNSSGEHEGMFSSDLTLGSFRTQERSVSPVAVANAVTRAIAGNPNISFIGNTEVLAADRLACGEMQVESRRNGEPLSGRYSCVANCLWDDKLRVDRTAGIPDQGKWLLRYKATITLTLPAPSPRRIPSATGILGSYGDVVNHDNGSYYLSWYPLCKVAQTTDGDGRKLHDMVHTGIISRGVRRMLSGSPSMAKRVASLAHRKFVRDNIKAMAAYVPALDHLLHNYGHCAVGGGVIVARGATDIDDPKSYLHQRSAVGPVAHGAYITIDTGKYSTAPLFAMEAADTIMDILQ